MYILIITSYLIIRCLVLVAWLSQTIGMLEDAGASQAPELSQTILLWEKSALSLCLVLGHMSTKLEDGLLTHFPPFFPAQNEFEPYISCSLQVTIRQMR